MNNHFLFIDDSGSKDWETPYAQEFISKPPVRNEQNLKFWRGNYFVLAGVHVSTDTLTSINPEINEIKLKTFHSSHVEIKSVWMRNPDKRKKHYLDPYKISENDLRQFTEDWYKILEENKAEIQLQAFVLDKRYFKNKRSQFTPLQMLVQVLFDRVELHPSRQCTIVFDQMDREIKSVKHHHGEILKISNKEIDLGSFQKKYSHFPPRFEASKNSNLLQLADTVAYNIYRQFVDYGGIWEDKNSRTLRLYPFLKRISDNFYHHKGRVAGFGIVKIPDPNKIRWRRKRSFKKPSFRRDL